MKKNIIRTFCFLFACVTFTIIKNVTNSNVHEIKNKRYLLGVTISHYYSGDAYNSGCCTGSGLCAKDFSVDEKGYYYYNHNGKDYLVVAAATTYCRDTKNHCGVDIKKHGMATLVNYYNYYDTVTFMENGVTYDAIVLDSCGGCMWSRQDDRMTNAYDIFTQNPNNPNACGASSINSNEPKPKEEEEIEHYTTSYSGDINQGWLYFRTRKFDEYKNLNVALTEEDMNEAIDKIFNRAREAYIAEIEKYDGNIYGALYGSTSEIPGNIKSLMDNYWYTFDINSYIGNTLFGQCVWYAKHRALEIIATSNLDDATKDTLINSIKATGGNGQDWYANPNDALFTKTTDVNSPKPGSLVSWSSGKYGHVGIIESVYEKNGETWVTLSEGHRTSIGKNEWDVSPTAEHAWSRANLSVSEHSVSEIQNLYGYNFIGYVYLTDS